MNRKKSLSLCVFILVLLCGGFVSSYLTMGNIAKMFHETVKPEWAPPSWLFAPVWTVLYIMIAVSGWMVWERMRIALPMGLYALQLVLNFAWTLIYFGMENIRLAFIDICLLDLSVIALIFTFKKYSAAASALLIPYFVWLIFATALNYSIMILN